MAETRFCVPHRRFDAADAAPTENACFGARFVGCCPLRIAIGHGGGGKVAGPSVKPTAATSSGDTATGGPTTAVAAAPLTVASAPATSARLLLGGQEVEQRL